MTSEKSTLDKIKGYLIPYHRCHYYSKLSKEEILGRIKKRTEPEQFFRMRGWLAGNNETKEFEGVVGQDEFKINKISKKKKNYAPVLSGRLSSSVQYTKVDISMRLSYLILMFVPIWFLFFGNVVFNGNFSFDDLSQGDFSSWFPVGIFVLIYAFLTGSFHYHVANVKQSLEQIIEPVDDTSAGSSGASWIIRN